MGRSALMVVLNPEGCQNSDSAPEQGLDTLQARISCHLPICSRRTSDLQPDRINALYGVFGPLSYCRLHFIALGLDSPRLCNSLAWIRKRRAAGIRALRQPRRTAGPTPRTSPLDLASTATNG